MGELGSQASEEIGCATQQFLDELHPGGSDGSEMAKAQKERSGKETILLLLIATDSSWPQVLALSESRHRALFLPSEKYIKEYLEPECPVTNGTENTSPSSCARCVLVDQSGLPEMIGDVLRNRRTIEWEGTTGIELFQMRTRSLLNGCI